METKRKTSKKRIAIMNALTAVTSHPTAEMLYASLKPLYPELSLGTVYRNLAVLAEEGLVVSVAHVDGQERTILISGCSSGIGRCAAEGLRA